MTLLQLNPSIPLDTPKGRGEALEVISQGNPYNHSGVIAVKALAKIKGEK